MSLASMVDNFYLSAHSAWLSRGRVLAVFSGVLLSTLLLTTVLSYGKGLSQAAMQDTIKDNTYDGLVYFKNEPGYKPGSRTDDADRFYGICDRFNQRPEFTDCGLVFAKQGFYPEVYSDGWDDENFRAEVMSQDIRLESVHDRDSQPDPANERGPAGMVMFLGQNGTDGPLGEVFSNRILDGEWFPEEFESTTMTAVIPHRMAVEHGLGVGDLFDLSYSFVSLAQDIGKMQGCDGLFDGNKTYTHQEEWAGKEFCRQVLSIPGVSVIGIYEPYPETWRQNNIRGRVILTTASLVPGHQEALMNTDHALLVLKVDRSLIPSNTIGDATDWLDRLESTMEGTPSGPVSYSGLEINYEDMSRGLLGDIAIFVVIVQAVDYVLMIPVILLSLAVLVYGLNLSLEQRRSEIAIHRVYGGTARSILGLILAEVMIVSVVAWVTGYVLGILSANFIIGAVGFMEFESVEYDLNGRTSLIPTLVIFLATVGLAMVTAWFKAKRFLEMQIEEGIRKETKSRGNRLLLSVNISLFLIGLASLVISVANPKLSFWSGASFVLGPFCLWIGGAIVLARLTGYTPKLTVLLLGRTRVLSDVRVGIRSSDSNRSTNQLGLIVIMTISIVTMAVFQGYTGSLVDERSASASVGADMQINLSVPMSEKEVLDLISSSISGGDPKTSITPKNIASIHRARVGVQGHRRGFDMLVLSSNHQLVLHWENQSIQKGLSNLSRLSGPVFISGADTAKKLDLAVQPDGAIDNLFSPFNDTFGSEDGNGSGFDSIDLIYPVKDVLAAEASKGVTVDYIGGVNWVPGIAQNVSSEVILVSDATFRVLNRGADYESSDWFVEFCDQKTDGCGDLLRAMNTHISMNQSVISVQDWATAYEEVRRNGGLIFGIPGILSLQYIAAAFASIASSLVFLSLTLTRRRRELAILQSMGASVTQLSRLVVFEILSVFTWSLLLGGLLGLGLAKTFTGLFSLLGGLFQLALESDSVVARELVWPWPQLLVLDGLVFASVLVALLFTTLRSVRSDLPTVLKEE